MKKVTSLFYYSVLIVTLCLLIVKGREEYSELKSGYPCRNTSDITVGFEHGLPPDKTNEFYVNIKKFFFNNCTVKVTFDAEVNVIFLDENNKWKRVNLRAGDAVERRFLKLQTGFSFVVKGTTTEHPNLTSLTVNDVQYCNEPIAGLFNNSVGEESLPKEKYECTANVTSPKSQKPDFQCGRRSFNAKWVTDPISGIDVPQDTGRVVNGEAKLGDWPWHAGLYQLPPNVTMHSSPRAFICGGTLISRSFIMTTAICTGIVKGQYNIIAVLGKHYLFDNNNTVIAEVERLIVPEDYYTRFLKDIALLKLKSEVQFSDYIRPACLWHRRKTDMGDEHENDDNVVGVLAGWGVTNDNIRAQPLQQVNLPIVPNDICIQSKPDFFGYAVNEYNFCAGYYKNGTAPCFGDNGGALQVFVPDETSDERGVVSGTWYVRGLMILGVVTKAEECDEDYYALFTKVEKLGDWIDNHVDF